VAEVAEVATFSSFIQSCTNSILSLYDLKNKKSILFFIFIFIFIF
jgi:hypothetical protein